MTSTKTHREISDAVKVIADWRSMMIVHAIFEHGPIRYKDLDIMLGLSPSIMSDRLSQLANAGLIARHKSPGIKEVVYEALPVASSMVEAYHILERVNDSLKSR